MHGATVTNCWPDFRPVAGRSEVSRSAVDVQRAYYVETSHKYDEIHQHDRDEHGLAFAYMTAMMDFLGIGSVLDVGSGTGFALLKLKEKMPHVRAVGVEPAPAQRAVGYCKGLSEAELVDGDAMRLAFADGSFDLVCEFGALHHIPRPELAISEMLRVARKAIFVCDTNNFGQGPKFSRWLKQAINAVGLWPVANLLKTKGKGYTLSDGDGVMYSYSVFTNYRQISNGCVSVHLFNVSGGEPNLYRTSSHVALFGVVRSKRDA
jgi:ubiquinone/menaquinone biosynthesis C-methylase UbiE